MSSPIPLPIKDAYLLQMNRFHDNRGYLEEIYNAEKCPEEISKHFPVQQNTVASSKKDVLRGIHVSTYAKLMTCVQGAVYDVVVDLRMDSPSYLKWCAAKLTADNRRQLLVPPGCGHAYYSLEKDSTVIYCQGGCFNPATRKEVGIWPMDPTIDVYWPSQSYDVTPTISEKDLNEVRLKETVLWKSELAITDHRKRVLVIGASGQVGGALIENFTMQVEFYSVYGTSHTHGREGMMPFDIARVANDDEYADLVFTMCHPHIVCICAAFSWVDGCTQDKDKSSLLNVTAVATLCKAAKAQGDCKVVFYSSDYVFDGNKEDTSRGYKEADTVNPVNVYGEHKVAAETVVMTTCPDALVLRISRVYGPEMQGKNFVYQLISKLADAEQLHCVTDEVSCPTYNRDIAQATRLLIEKKCSGLYHCVGPQSVSKYQWALLLAEYFQLDVSLIKETSNIDLNLVAKRPTLVSMSTEKLRTELAELKLHTIEEGLADWKLNMTGKHLPIP